MAHGTFFFHFPSKEHVLLELESREEARHGQRNSPHSSTATHDLATVLTEAVHLVTGLEQRLGSLLFKELLALHFSPTRPTKDEWTDHPVIVLLVREIERARGDGDVHPEVDAFYSAAFFLLGIYGVLTTTANGDTRDTMLAKLVATARTRPGGPMTRSTVRIHRQGGLTWTGYGRSFDTSPPGAEPV